jgi:hypothetical protein
VVFSLLSVPLETSVATITEIQQQVHSLESLCHYGLTMRDELNLQQ